ncbi:hypothetical protein AcW1_007026 [Taiwanofungus camphoratus]|nr:hypothetical protein AcV5_002829 [Antrodia cinnamomea]KAI0925086.1 hypothetical protein AcW2_005778 [Antrodia cinnamomea]KAI0955441.1 hypothetical protein AcW1_007026 [Antrodia cinnamomea]
MALASFGTSACLYLTKEQQSNPTNLRESTVKWHFLAFFISAGLFSALASHVVSARITFPRLVSHLSSSVSTVVRSTASGAAKSASASASASAAKEASSTILPSLGASGAIYATVTLTAMAFPDTAISLIFPPTPPIPIQYGVFGLMSLDILGALRGWRVFDHYAHLGGAVFGILYYAYGPQVWEFFRHRTLGSLPSSLRKV